METRRINKIKSLRLKPIKSKDCYPETDVYKLSYRLFKNALSINEFLEFWKFFYSNQICIPTYHATYINNDDFATINRANKFKIIIDHGLIPVDSDGTELDIGERRGCKALEMNYRDRIYYYQLGYVMVYVPNELVDKLEIRLSHIDDIMTEIIDENDCYDRPTLNSWMSAQVKSIFDNYSCMLISVRTTKYPSEYVFDMLILALENLKK